MGAVAQTDPAIMNEAHRHGLIADKRYDKDTTQAAGAYVADLNEACTNG